jgi:hypothetical protein
MPGQAIFDMLPANALFPLKDDKNGDYMLLQNTKARKPGLRTKTHTTIAQIIEKSVWRLKS